MSAAIQQQGRETKQGMQLCLLDCLITLERPKESGSRNKVDHHTCTPLETSCWKCHHMGPVLTQLHLCKASGKNVNCVFNSSRSLSYKCARPFCHIFQILKQLPNVFKFLRRHFVQMARLYKLLNTRGGILSLSVSCPFRESPDWLKGDVT